MQLFKSGEERKRTRRNPNLIILIINKPLTFDSKIHKTRGKGRDGSHISWKIAWF